MEAEVLEPVQTQCAAQGHFSGVDACQPQVPETRSLQELGHRAVCFMYFITGTKMDLLEQRQSQPTVLWVHSQKLQQINTNQVEVVAEVFDTVSWNQKWGYGGFRLS